MSRKSLPPPPFFLFQDVIFFSSSFSLSTSFLVKNGLNPRLLIV